jgi:Transcription factor zinc-finger
MNTQTSGRCPNCSTTMKLHTLPAHYGNNVSVDACHDCHALWFDTTESTQLSPDGVVELFRLVHDAPGISTPKWGEGLGCVRCRAGLKNVQDVVQGSRFNYQSCNKGHGRLIGFYQFLTEKKFVRELTAAERNKLAAEVKQIRCAGCAAPVNLATQNACEYCRAPISVFDRNAAQKAIDHYLKERGKQLPARPYPTTSQHSGGTVVYNDGYSGAELAADALWALAHFAARSTRHVGSRASAGAPVVLTDAVSALPTADELLGNTSAGIEGFARAVGEQSVLGDALTSVSDIAQSVDWSGSGETVANALADSGLVESVSSTLGESIEDNSDSLLDLVGDGLGSFVSSIFD